MLNKLKHPFCIINKINDKCILTDNNLIMKLSRNNYNYILKN